MKCKYLNMFLVALIAMTTLASCLSDGDETIALENGNAKELIMRTNWRIKEWKGNPPSGLGWKIDDIFKFENNGTFRKWPSDGKTHNWHWIVDPKGGDTPAGITIDDYEFGWKTWGPGFWVLYYPRSEPDNPTWIINLDGIDNNSGDENDKNNDNQTEEDPSNKPQSYDAIETLVTFEDAMLDSNGTMQGTSYISKGDNAYVFDNFVDISEGNTAISYGYTISKLTTTKLDVNVSPYAAFTSMLSAHGTKFAHYIPNDHKPQYIHRKDGKTFKPYYIDLAVSSKTIQAAINGYGDDKPFTEKDSISVCIRGVETLGYGSTNKLNFNIIYKNGLLYLDSYIGDYIYLNFKNLPQYDKNLWIPMYLTSLGTVSRLLIEMKSTKKNTPLGIAIDNFTTYTTKTTDSTTEK